VSVDDVNVLSNQDFAKKGEGRDEGRSNNLVSHSGERAVVDLQTVGDISHTHPIVIRVCDNNDFMSFFD